MRFYAVFKRFNLSRIRDFFFEITAQEDASFPFFNVIFLLFSFPFLIFFP